MSVNFVAKMPSQYTEYDKPTPIVSYDAAPYATDRKYFRPWLIHKRVLIFFLLVTLALVGLVEYACRTLPLVRSDGSFTSLVNKTSTFHRKDDSEPAETSTYVTEVQGTLETLIVSYGYVADTSTTCVGTCAPNKSIYLALGTVTVVQTTTPLPSSTIPTQAPASTLSKISSSTPADTPQNIPSSILTDGAPESQPNIPASTQTIIQESSSAGPLPNSPTITPQSIASTIPSIYSSNSQIGLNGLSSAVSRASEEYTQTSELISYIPSTTISSALPTVTSGNPAPSIFLQTGSTPVYVFTPGQFFLGTYLPTILAVLFTILWILLDNTMKKIEPIHQLANSSGASASSTLLIDYNSPISLFAPFKAAYYQHWTVLLTSISTFLCLLISPLAPSTVFIHLDGACDAETTGCIPSLGLFLPAARAIQALLSMMALLVLLLIALLHTQQTRVYSDPRSIAGIAVLFDNPHVQWQFGNIVGQISSRRLRDALEPCSNRLGSFARHDGSTGYGLTRVSEVSYTPDVAHDTGTSTLQWHPQMVHSHRITAGVLATFLSALLAVIIAYRFNHSSNGFETFMDSQGFFVRFIFTAVGVLIKLYWGRVFQETSRLAPYRRLARRNSPAQASLLTNSHSHPISAIPTALRHHQIVLALVASTAVLSDVLTVTISTVPFNNATSWTTYNVSTWLSVSIVTLMLVTLGVLFFYPEPNLPVPPKTIAAHLYYLCGSHVPEAFKDLSYLDTKERDKKIREMGLGYSFGLVACMDGVTRVGIDFEEFVYRNG